MRSKCFFDGVHGAGECAGAVTPVAADNLPPFMRNSKRFRGDTHYCEQHRANNTARARWEGVGRPTPGLMIHLVQDENETIEWEGKDV